MLFPQCGKHVHFRQYFPSARFPSRCAGVLRSPYGVTMHLKFEYHHSVSYMRAPSALMHVLSTCMPSGKLSLFYRQQVCPNGASDKTGYFDQIWEFVNTEKEGAAPSLTVSMTGTPLMASSLRTWLQERSVLSGHSPTSTCPRQPTHST